MGEVYRARDTRLDRTVAIKVISAGLAQDDEARSRFEQEARTIAALNDPHICTIHDVGRHGDADYLVLEYLEGESLEKRLNRPPVLSIKEALAFAIQIGRGLDRAHHAGIAHRDLKPGNVMLVAKPESPGSCDVKLMDFGLASRTATSGRAKSGPALNETISASIAETRGSGGANVSGLSGTLQYISPEQLNGSEGDERADIFAFGCVLYEMLAGRKAFEGTTALMVLAAIASAEPPPIERIAQAHPLLDHVLRRCLEKDREQRWQSIRDAVGELEWIADRLDAAPASHAAGLPPPARSRAIQRFALPAAVVFAVAAAIWAWAARTGPAPVDLPAMTFTVATAPTGDSSVAVSPDGRHVAFVADHDGDPMLWVRPLAETEGRILPGTTGATQPFWSPDGRTVAFFAEDKLKRIDLTGDRPVVIADAPNARGGTWSRDGTILFAPGVSAPIVRVASRGGSTEPVTRLNAETGPSHRWPQFLPDGRRFANDSRGWLYLIDAKNQPQIYLDVGATFPLSVYNRLESGFIGFVFHPEFATNGLLYTVHAERGPGNPKTPDFIPVGYGLKDVTYHNVITEWRATNPAAKAQFQAHYGSNSVLYGPYSGKLDNSNERIELYKPDPPQTAPHPDVGFVPYIRVDRVVYANSAPWPTQPDGGHRLRRDAAADLRTARRLRAERLRQHRRRMLRHHAGRHPRDRRRPLSVDAPRYPSVTSAADEPPTGISPWTTAPSPGSLRTERLPPTASRRSAIPCRPVP
jgi:hypothetical protein